MQEEQIIRSAHFDCQFGAAGDMLLAALLDTGLDFDKWQEEARKIALAPGSFSVELSKVWRASLVASRVEIKIDQGQEERSFREIRELIFASGLSAEVRDLSHRIFARLARAEAKVHGCSPEDVHFHEIGALDSIVDIIGFAIAYYMAGIKQVSCSPLTLGSGVVMTQHGNYPVPAPAVLHLISECGAPASSGIEIPFECLTPTAAAILAEISSSWGKAASFARLLSQGYGAGQKDPEGWPNCLRVLITSTVLPSSGSGSDSDSGSEPAFEFGRDPDYGLGLVQADASRSEFGAFACEELSVLECSIDDMSPQALSYAVEKLFAAGALDVVVLPALMKKGRSGHLLSVSCSRDKKQELQALILRETTSLGVRSRQETRLVAERRIVSVSLDGFSLRLKLAEDRLGNLLGVQPEFDDLCHYARQTGISIKEANMRLFQAYNLQTEGANEQTRAKLKAGWSLLPEGVQDV